MSVSSDFWTSQEAPGSSARRLAQSFRRASAASSSRQPGSGDTQELRRPSLAALPFRSSRSRKSVASRTGESSTSPVQRLDRVFFFLPPEIQVEVISHLERPDVFALRLSCRAALTVLNSNASAVSRLILNRTSLKDDPIYLRCLYPQPVPCLNTNHMLQMLRRQILVDQIVEWVVDFIKTKIYLIRSGPRVKQFEPYRHRLRNRLHKPAFITFHYLENLRRIHLLTGKDQQDMFGTPPSLASAPYQDALIDLVDEYPKDDVVSAYQFHKLLMLTLRQCLRAPSYAGTLERTLRGWAREPAKDEEIAQLLILGGLEQALNIIKASSYANRLDKVMFFVDKVTYAAKHANDRSVLTENSSKFNAIQEIATPFHRITPTSLALLPPLDEILVPAFQDRIIDERLVDHARELSSPFGFIQGIMAESDTSRSSLSSEAVRRGENFSHAASASQPRGEIVLPRPTIMD